MKNEIEITELLGQIRQSEGEAFEFDEGAIRAEYQKQDSGQSSLAIKILTIFGGFLATLAFVGFLMVAGLYDSEIGLLVLGIASIFGAVWMNKKYDALLMDTGSISLFAVGFLLMGMGLSAIELDENLICIVFMLLAVLALLSTQNYMLSFISVLIFTGSILALVLLHSENHFIHLYISGLAVLLTVWFLKEAKIISARNLISKRYYPIRIGLVISYLGGLVFLGKLGLFPTELKFIWLSSIAGMACVIYIIYRLCPMLNINANAQKFWVCGLGFLLLLPTAMSPAISGALLIIMLGFWVNFKTGFAFGIVAFIYFIGQFYYDLNFTLLAKSIVLFWSGILFLCLYIFTHKKFRSHEKV